MALSVAYWFLLVVSLMAMFMQLMATKKNILNIVFAVFCGSIAMMAAQVISADAFGKYSVLFGLGACATCNGFWLVARALFRQKNAIGIQHLMFAGLIAVLALSKKGIDIAEQFWLTDLSAFIAANAVLGELIALLSSSILLLSFWEGCRGWHQCRDIEKRQRLLFLCTYGGAVLSTTIIGTALSTATGSDIKAWFIPFASTSIIVVTQILIIWQGTKKKSENKTTDTSAQMAVIAKAPELVYNNSLIDDELAQQLETLLIKQQQFLKANLKVADLARELDVSEYRISRVLKYHFKADNFNRFVNQLRVEHAKKLLQDKDKAHWPVLVVGLESGFASVGPFTRAFKDFNGCTPGYFRKQVL